MKTSSHTVIDYLRSLVHRRGDAADNDRELLRRFAERRDEDAFAVLLRRHGAMVLNSARRITGDEQLAEDVFQATFLLLSRKGQTIRRPEALPCWLHGVAHRLAVQARRAHRIRQERESQIQRSSPPTPLEQLSAQEFLAVLDEELRKLPANYGAPLILCCLEGLSQEETAKRLGCSTGAVKGRLERGRQRLRKRLEKRGLTLPAVFGGTLLMAGAVKAVPPMLVQSTLRAALGGAGATPAAAALIQEMMRMMFIHKVKTIGVVGMLFALTGTGVGMMTLRPQAAKENTPPTAASNDKPLSADKRVDLYGDPLPVGAVMRLGTLQRRAVRAQLAVTADGQSIVGVRAGKIVSIWDAATGKLRHKRELAGEAWGQFALSRDGQWLARVILEREYRLEIWDARAGRKVRDLAINKGNGYIMPVAFSADGKHVAAVGTRQAVAPDGDGVEDHSVRAWEVATGKQIFAADVRSKGSSGLLVFAPDGKRLLASFSSIDDGMYCWDIGTGRRLWQNKRFRGDLFTSDSKVLSSNPRSALDLETGRGVDIPQLPPFHPDMHWTLAPDGRTLLLANDKGVSVWDLKEGKERRMLKGAGESLVVAPDSKSILTNNGMLQRWDLATGKALWTDTSALGHVGEVTDVAFSADGKQLVSASTDGTVRLWDVTTGRPLRVWRGHEGQRPTSGGRAEAGVKTLDISADGRRVVSAGSDECVKLWDITADKEVRSIALPRAENGEWGRRFYHMRISPEGRQIVGIFGPRGVRLEVSQPVPKITDKFAVWDAETGSLLAIQAVEAVRGSGVFSPDARTLLTGNTLIDVMSRKKIADLPGLGDSKSAAFSRDGALVIGQAVEERKQDGITMVSATGLRVWEAATGKIIARLKNEPWVAQTAFHPDNRFIVANDLIGIHLHNVRGGEIVARFQMPESIRADTTRGSYAGCLAFSRDGRRMATGHPDSTILVWNVPLPPSQTVAMSAKELGSLWANLADVDAAKAWRAVWRLTDSPQDALTFLHGRVKPYPTAPAEVMRKLLADLDGDSFEVREAAAKQLKELRLQAEPALRAALAAKPLLEQRRRIEELLAALQVAPPSPTPEELRQLRALIVLEHIGSPEARRLLGEVAKGPPSARLTRQAQAVLNCLR